MDRNTTKCLLLAAAALATGSAHAIPVGLLDQDGGYVDVTTSVISGAALYSYRGRPPVLMGTPIGESLVETMANKDYTALVGQLGNADDNHESYLEQPGSLGMVFASAYADAAGNLEVGVDGFNFGPSIAVSRFRLDIKNARSYPIGLNFAFQIPEGILRTYDPAQWHGTDPLAVRSVVRANIDGVLLTPEGPFGGTFEETLLEDMFDFRVALQGAGNHTCNAATLSPGEACNGKVIEYTDNAFPYLHEVPATPGVSIWGFDIDPYEGLLALPEIAPHGEFTLYYDMYSMVIGWAESGGRAMLGDPFTLSLGNGIGIIETSTIPGGGPPVTAVPEPSMIGLAVSGLLGLALVRLRRRGSAAGTFPAPARLRNQNRSRPERRSGAVHQWGVPAKTCAPTALAPRDLQLTSAYIRCSAQGTGAAGVAHRPRLRFRSARDLRGHTRRRAATGRRTGCADHQSQ